MASRVRLVWKRDGLYELRRQPGVIRDLERRGRAVLAAVGGEAAGYMMSSSQGARNPQGRWRVAVFTATARAMRSNARHNTLVRNFGAARG
ncbi:hypothetical protein [Nocardia sp. NPDC052566]|uniref:hypothetical protein n=1 Tax=Nocardia sp. NPDC052566 TaxID=3364330 RepID=UPI0037CC95CA